MTRETAPSDPRRAEINRTNARQPRISKQLRRAVEAMIWEGLPRRDAAQRVGMTEHGLYKALRKAHVKALFAQEHKSLRDGEAIRAYSRQVQLAETAQSEDVRYKANSWIAGCDALAPVQKVHAQHQVTHAFEGIGFAPPPEQAATIDSDAEHVTDAEVVSEPEPGEVDPADVVLVEDGDEG